MIFYKQNPWLLFVKDFAYILETSGISRNIFQDHLCMAFSVV